MNSHITTLCQALGLAGKPNLSTLATLIIDTYKNLNFYKPYGS